MAVLDAKPARVASTTYQYLRLAMVGVLAALAASVLIEMARSGWCTQLSISAYYFTPTRAVFVGALITLGVAMVVVEGHTVAEDVALNFAGLLAPIVAFVPTGEYNNCSLVRASGETVAAGETAPGARAAAAALAEQAVVNNMVAYLVVVLLGLVVGWLALRTRADPEIVPYRAAWFAACALWTVVAVTLFWFEDFFIRRAHLFSAVLLFGCIVTVVAANAVRRTSTDVSRTSVARVRAASADRYGRVAWAMVLSAAGIAGYRWLVGWDHWLLWMETALLVFFATFWMLQTLETWGDDHNGAKEAVGTRNTSSGPLRPR